MNSSGVAHRSCGTRSDKGSFVHGSRGFTPPRRTYNGKAVQKAKQIENPLQEDSPAVVETGKGPFHAQSRTKGVSTPNRRPQTTGATYEPLGTAGRVHRAWPSAIKIERLTGHNRKGEREPARKSLGRRRRGARLSRGVIRASASHAHCAGEGKRRAQHASMSIGRNNDKMHVGGPVVLR